MKPQPCKVEECGAVVYVVRVDGQEVAVNPAPVELVVPREDGPGYRLLTGYQPHWRTCVDIATRQRHRHGPHAPPWPRP